MVVAVRKRVICGVRDTGDESRTVKPLLIFITACPIRSSHLLRIISTGSLGKSVCVWGAYLKNKKTWKLYSQGIGSVGRWKEDQCGLIVSVKALCVGVWRWIIGRNNLLFSWWCSGLWLSFLYWFAVRFSQVYHRLRSVMEERKESNIFLEGLC